MLRTPRLHHTVTRLAAAALLGLAAPHAAWASHVGEALSDDQAVVATTDSLLRTLQQWETTPAAQRSQRTAQLVQATARRRDQLLALLARNPTVAASRFLPAAVRDRLPAEAQAHVEREVRAAGTVVAVIADDFVRGRSKQEFFLHVNDNAAQRLQLHLADALAGERDLLGWVGRKVSLNGTQLDGQLVITDKRSVLVAADGSGSTTSTVGTTPIVKGDQKTLTILANFSDKALTCTTADVQTRVFGAVGASVNTNYRNSSRNLVSFSGQAVGPYTISYSAAGSCDYSGWASAAEAAARAAGIDPSQYARVNYVTPPNGSCGWSGLAYMPGRQSWVQSCAATGVYSHELGHNLAFHHAGTPSAEYGDGSDPMGGAKTVLHNAANRVMAGWMAPGTVVDVAGGGSFGLDALELPAPTSPQVMRIYKPDTKEWYHISLRQALDLDSALSATYLNALSVTKASGTLPAKTTLMAALQVGQSWSDGVNGITVSHQGLAGSTSTVGVTMTGEVCARSAPTVAVSPGSQSGPPGTSRGYAVSVKNNNTTACGPSSFALAQVLPAGFSGSVPASLSVAAGATANATWTVTPSTGTAAGSYALDVSAGDGSGTATKAHATYSVMVDTTPPSVAITAPSNGSTVSGSRATISATASDPTSGIARVEFYVDGRLLSTDTSAPYGATWSLRKAGKGTHVLRVRAVDGAGMTADASSSVTVN